MKNYTKAILSIIILVIVVFIILSIWGPKSAIVENNTITTTQNTQTTPLVPVATASYACNMGKTIDAVFYKNSAAFSLSDGRKLTLAQTVSADGNRYSTKDGSFIFWGKGNGATILENNIQKDYLGCIIVKPAVGTLEKVYQSGAQSFSIRYPQGYSVNESYVYQGFGPGKDIHGIKFTIPAGMASGTNLSSDSYLSVESIPNSKMCTAALFSGNSSNQPKSVTDEGTTYSVINSSDAAAGNRYDETIYAVPSTNPCVAIRYFIHYGAIQNYPVGKVAQFDKNALIAQFDSIRRSLTINQ